MVVIFKYTNLSSTIAKKIVLFLKPNIMILLILVSCCPFSKFHHHQESLQKYAKEQERPLGLIHLLPAAIYFPGRPEQAFEYILKIDFFDIKNAPYYPATICALIAEILCGC